MQLLCRHVLLLLRGALRRLGDVPPAHRQIEAPLLVDDG